MFQLKKLEYEYCIYKLEVQVMDESRLGYLVLWDQDCNDLIGIPVVDLRKKMTQEQLQLCFISYGLLSYLSTRKLC